MTRPGGGGLYLHVLLKPKTKVEDGGSVKGPKPRGDLRPVEINRHMYMTCIVRQELVETESDIVYESAETL